jgi:hypothetical protein
MEVAMFGTVNVIERVLASGSRYFQYDFRVELPDGKIYRERRKARGATTQAAARQLGLRRLQEVLKAGPKPRGGRDADEMPTVARFAPEWLKICRAERQKPATIENKEHVLKNHILPLIGRLRLDEVREATISKIKRERGALAPSTVNFILKHVIALLHCARSEGYKIEIPTGGLTTYSSFNYETTRLLEEGAFATAALNVTLTIVGAFAAGWCGLLCARQVLGR